MKKIYLFIVFLSIPIIGFANIITGQQYKISSASITNKSIFASNSSLFTDAGITLWTETNVPAQRWIFIANDDNTYTLVNTYSQYVLYRKGSAVDGSPVLQSNSSTTSASRWTLTPVLNQSGYYYITQPNKDGNALLYMEASSTADGAAIELHDKKIGNDSLRQIWKFDLNDTQIRFSQKVRDETMSGWKTKYYKQAPTGYVLGNGGWWGDAEMFEIVLDAYETTGDATYETMYRQLYKNFIARNQSNWLYNDFNDDIAWMVIASVRGYLMFGDATFLSYAKTNFDNMYARALLPSGMLRWKETTETQNGTNSCINGPAEVAACYLAMAMEDDSYYDKAKNLYALQRKYLFVPATGQVYDSFTWATGQPSGYNYWASTYNQGTFLGAAVMLYNHYGNNMYRDDAEMIMKYTTENLCDENGYINVCQVGSGDLAGFKGILMRYVRRLITDLKKTEYVDWMQKNAFQAYNNRNSLSLTSSAWLTKTPENFILTNCTENCDFTNDPFGPSTVVSAAFNAPLDESKIIKDAYSTIQAECFDYIKGVYTQIGTNQNDYEIGNIKAGNYVGYNNVNFGNSLATSIELSVSRASVKGSIEVHQGGAKGPLLGTISVPTAGDDWQILTGSITPITGMQNIYLVFNGVSGQSNIFRVDYFRFITENKVYSDITDNSGSIYSSLASNTINYAIDNNLITSSSFSTNANFKLCYKSPKAVLLQAYAVFSANSDAQKDLKSWSLQASNDSINWIDIDVQNNQQFSGRYTKKVYAVSLSNSYLYFRLNIRENNGNTEETQLGEWQLYGTCMFDNDITADGGVLSAQYVGNESEETYVGVTDKSSLSKYLVIGQSDLWIQYQANGIYKLNSYSLTSANDEPERDPKSWVLYGSNDGANWIKIDQQENQGFNYRYNTQYYNVNQNVGYQYYKLHVVANNGSSMTQLAEWQLFGDLYYDNMYNDITMNGGSLSVSDNNDSKALQTLTDNNGNTTYTLDASTIPAWIQYKSTTPVSVLAYSVVSGYDSDKSPKNWSLQGSNDGQNWTNIHNRSNVTFSQRGERKVYTVTATTAYTFFRLNITKLSNTNSSEVILGEWEIHGTGLSATDITNNSGTITAEQIDKNSSEGVSMLIDKLEGTKYCNLFYGSSWVNYKSPYSVKVNAYSITSANDEETRDPRSWILEASIDGTSWELIDSRNNQNFPYRGVTQYYACNKDLKSFSNFRLNITENSGSTLMQFAEWQLLNMEGVDGDPNSVDVAEMTNIVVYPTLVQEVLSINMPEKGTVSIFNVMGQNVFLGQLNAGVNTLRMSDFKQGYYFIVIQEKNYRITKKIFKK